MVKPEKYRVYFLTAHTKVYVWTFKKGVRQVDTQEAMKYAGPVSGYLGFQIGDTRRLGIFDIIPHPLLEDTFYLLALQDEPITHEKPNRTLVVLEYNHSGTLRLHTTALPQVRSLTRRYGTGDFTFDWIRRGNNDENRFDRRQGYEDSFRPMGQKADMYGNYALCQFTLRGWINEPEEFLGMPDYRWDDSYDDGRLPAPVYLGFTVFFDALAASVSVSPFLHATDVTPPPHMSWGSQQIDLICAPTEEAYSCFAMLLVSELNGPQYLQSTDDLPVHCPSAPEAVGPGFVTRRLTKRLDNTPARVGKVVPGYTRSNLVSQFLAQCVRHIPSYQPLYGLDITSEYRQLEGGDYNRARRNRFHLMTDEDFLICAGPMGYVAWSFYHDMKDLHVKA